MARPRIHSDDLLLEAARREFAANGYRAASMEDIAASAGTTKPTLYARFHGKEPLYARTVRDRARALLDHLSASYDQAADLSVHEMIDAATRAYLDYFEREPADFELLFRPDRSGPAIQLADEVLDGIIDGITRLVDGVLARDGRRAPQDARLIAAMLVGVAHHALRELAGDPQPDREHAARLATSFCYAAVRGLAPELINAPLRRGSARGKRARPRRRAT